MMIFHYCLLLSGKDTGFCARFQPVLQAVVGIFINQSGDREKEAKERFIRYERVRIA